MITQQQSSIVSLRSLARELQVSQRWLKQEASEGRIPALRAGANSFIFDRASVTEALARRAAETTGDGR